MKDFTPHLKRLRKVGGWIHCSSTDAYKIVEGWMAHGLPFTDELARLDLLYWMDIGDVKPIRYYEARWGVTYYRAQKIMNEMGVFDTVDEVRKELGSSDQRSITDQSEIDQDSIADQSHNGENDAESNKGQSQINQDSIADQSPINQYTQTSDSDPEKRRRDPREDGPPDAIPVLAAWKKWIGIDELTVAFRLVIDQLMQPAGGVAGARLSNDPTRKMYNGFTAEQMIEGIEALAKRAHKSPDSLIKHVAGEMPPAGETHGTRGKNDAGPRKRTQSEYQQRREVGTSPVDAERVEEFGDVWLAGVDEEIERERGERREDQSVR